MTEANPAKKDLDGFWNSVLIPEFVCKYFLAWRLTFSFFSQILPAPVERARGELSKKVNVDGFLFFHYKSIFNPKSDVYYV